MASVVIDQLIKKYGSNTVVDSVSLTIAEGEFLTLLGPSGCGKTTTLRCIAGLERPDGGTIRIGSKTVVGEGTFVPPNKRGLGMVFQSYALWPHMSVAGNVGYPLKRSGVRGLEQKRRIHAALEVVGLGHLASRSVGTLSGGQQQRVALARAIVAEPPLILFDEPLSNLDTRLRSTMREELRELRERLGTTSIYVTHDQTEALTLSDRIVVLNQGIIQQVGTPEDIYSAPANLFVAQFLGFENILQATVTRAYGGSLTIGVGSAGTLELQASRGDFQVGDSVVLATRASDIQIAPDHDDEPGLRTTLSTRTFLGDQIEFLTDVDGQPMSIRFPSNSAQAHEYRQGDSVRLSLSAGKYSLFAASDQAHAQPTFEGVMS